MKETQTVKTTWHILTLGGYVSGFSLLRDAVWEVQCLSGSVDRPTKFAAGFYEMTGGNEESVTTYYICTTQMALRQGFDWIEEIKNLT